MNGNLDVLKLLKGIKQSGIEICLISKYWTDAQLMNFYNEGYRQFGENRVNKLVERANNFPNDIDWHFVGNLQSKDLSKICKHAKIIQSFDRPDLLPKLAKFPEIEILIQLNLSEQKNRNGILIEDLDTVMQEIEKYEINCNGFMLHPPADISIEKKKSLFGKMQRIFSNYSSFKILSMGTSHDFELANQFGATLNRLGRILINKNE